MIEPVESTDDLVVPTWMYLSLVGGLGLVHVLCLFNGFVDFDDDSIFLRNPHFELDWAPFLSWAFDLERPDTWRPLRDLSHYLDLRLHGQNPFWAHLHNLVLLGVTSILMLRFFITTGIEKRLAFAAVLLAFAHPVQVEAITWISGRKDLLAAPLVVCTLLVFVRFCKSERAVVLWGLLLSLLSIMAVMAKGHVIVIPIILFWVYILMSQNSGHGDNPPRIRVGVLLSVLLLLAIGIAPRIAAGGVSLLTELQESAISGILPGDKLQLPLRYAVLFVWPVELNHIYFTPRLGPWHTPLAIGSCALVLCLITLAIRWLRDGDPRGPLLAIGCTLMLPYMHLKTGVVYMADRYLFLALPFFMLPLCMSVIKSAAWHTLSTRWRHGVTSTIFVLMIIGSAGPHSAFRDSVSLWTRMTEVYDASDWGYDRLGRALYNEGDYEAAAGAWLKAWSLRPGVTKHLNNAAVAAMALGKNRMALDLLKRILTFDPGNKRALSNVLIIQEASAQRPSEDHSGSPPRPDPESEKR